MVTRCLDLRHPKRCSRQDLFIPYVQLWRPLGKRIYTSFKDLHRLNRLSIDLKQIRLR